MWEILGIAPTRDIKEIKSAYARLAKQFNPEEKPEDFKRIFEAYKAACRYAGNMKKTCADVQDMQSDENEIELGSQDNYGKNDTSTDDVTPKYDFSEINSVELDAPEITPDEKRQVLLKIMSDIISDESKCNDIRTWQGFLDCDELDDFIYEPQFRREVNSLLAATLFTWETANAITGKFGWGSGPNPWEYTPFNLRIYHVNITEINMFKWENMSRGEQIILVILGIVGIAAIIRLFVNLGLLIGKAAGGLFSQ